MGADLILTWTPLPAGVVSDHGWVQPAAVGAVIVDRARALTTDRMLEIDELQCFGILDNYEGDLDDDGNPVQAGVFRNAFVDRVSAAWAHVVEGDRYTLTGYFMGVPHLVSGGTSWGDTPSELFDDVTLLAESGVLNDPMPWAPAQEPDVVLALRRLSMSLDSYGFEADGTGGWVLGGSGADHAAILYQLIDDLGITPQGEPT